MSRSEKLQREIDAAEQKKRMLQDKIDNLQKQKKAAIDVELLGEIRSLSCNPIDVKKIVAAIRRQDYETLKSYGGTERDITL